MPSSTQECLTNMFASFTIKRDRSNASCVDHLLDKKSIWTPTSTPFTFR